MTQLSLLLAMMVLPALGIGDAAAFVTKSGAVGGQVWEAGTYQVTGDLTVANDSTLTLEPGCVVKFNFNTGLRVNGTLLAHGTETDGIVFTGRDDDTVGEVLPTSDGTPVPGDWDGLYGYGYSVALGVLELEHALLRYGGGSAANYQGGLYLYYSDRADLSDCVFEHCLNNGVRTSAAGPVFTRCTFRDNGGHGLYGTSGGRVRVWNCAFTDNTGYAAYLDGVDPADCGYNSGSGNGTDALALDGTLSGSARWLAQAPGFCIALLGEVGVLTADTLTIGAGVIVKALPGASISVDGALLLQGTADSLVVITSMRDDAWAGDSNNDGADTIPVPGDWLGIDSYGYLAQPGLVEAEHSLLRYGGNAGSTWDANLRFNYSDTGLFRHSTSEYSATAGIKVSQCRATLEHSTFRGNLGHGVEGGGQNQTGVTDCQFLDNGGHGAWLASSKLMTCGGNGGSGNGVNGFGLAGSTEGSAAWSSNQVGFPYVLTGALNIASTDSLAVGPGVVVKCATGAYVSVDGALLLRGAADSLVVFTSLQDDSRDGDTNGDGSATAAAPGDWKGIDSNGYLARPGIIEADHCLLRYGGDPATTWDANLNFSYSDTGHFRNSTSEHSATSGLRVSSAAPLIEQSAFHANLLTGIKTSGVDAIPNIHGCVFTGHPGLPTQLSGNLGNYGGNSGSGNGVNGLGVAGNVASRAWQANDASFPYVLTDDLTVTDDDTLRLGPGVVVKAAAEQEVYVRGTLVAAGTEAEPVRFTSLRDDEWGGDTNADGAATTPAPGDWDGIEAFGYTVAQGALCLDFCQVRYGGGGANAADIYVNDSDEALLTNCLIERSAADGIRCAGSSPVIGHSRIVDNSGTGIRVQSGLPRFGAADHGAGGYNVFAGNEGNGFQVRNETNDAIEACYNDWGVHDPAAIDALIWDDEESSHAEVIFDPFIDDEAPTRVTLVRVDEAEEGDTVLLCWRPVEGATGYTVYSSADARDGFALDEGGAFDGASWTAPLPDAKRFYQVRVVTD